MPGSGVSGVDVEHLNELANISAVLDSPPALERRSAALLPESRFGERHELFFDVPVLHRIIGMAQRVNNFHAYGVVPSRVVATTRISVFSGNKASIASSGMTSIFAIIGLNDGSRTASSLNEPTVIGPLTSALAKM